MRQPILCVAFFLIAGCQTPPTNPTPSVDPAETIAAWTAAIRSGDVDRVLSFYDDSPETTLIHSTGDVRLGAEAIRTDYTTAFEQVTFLEVSVELSSVTTVGDITWATGRHRWTSLFKAENSEWIGDIYTTFVLRNRAGTWKIAFEQSTPIAGVPRLRRKT